MATLTNNQPAQPATTTAKASSPRKAKLRNATLKLFSRKFGNEISTVYLSYDFTQQLFKCAPNEVTVEQLEDKGIPALFETDKLECVVINNKAEREAKEALLNTIVDVEALV